MKRAIFTLIAILALTSVCFADWPQPMSKAKTMFNTKQLNARLTWTSYTITTGDAFSLSIRAQNQIVKVTNNTTDATAYRTLVTGESYAPNYDVINAKGNLFWFLTPSSTLPATVEVTYNYF